MKIKDKQITQTGDRSDTKMYLAHLEDTGKAYIGISEYGEVGSISLSKSQVKSLINWLEAWIKFKEKLKWHT